MGNSPVAGDKRKRTQLTLYSLPHEVVLSIVEWTAQITLEDQLSQERLAHELQHEEHNHHIHHHLHAHADHHHQHHLHQPPPGHPLAFPGFFGQPHPFIQAAPTDEDADGDALANPPGIGGAAFMQNLFGFLNNPAPAANAPPPAPAPDPLAVPMPAPPMAHFTQNDQAAEDVYDEMLPQQPMGAPAPEPASSTSESIFATMDTNMETVGSHNVPPMEATASAPMVPTLPGTISFTAQTGEDEDEMPPPEHGNLGQHPMPFGPGTADTGPVPWPANDMPFPPFPQNANSFETPFASAPLTGALASELHQLQQSTSDYTAQDLEDMPDMESPSVPLHQSLLMEESDWSTEQEDEEEEEDQTDNEDDEGGEEEDHSDAIMSDAGHDSMPDRVPVCYEDGLPSCPYLPLALVNRSFLNATRTLLYGRTVHLIDTYQAHLFLRTLTSPQVSVYDDDDPELDADDEDARQQQMLSNIVRDVAFDVRSLISLGRGGGSLFIDIIRNCPRLERVACNADFMRSAQKPLESALAGCTNLRALHLRGGDVPAKDVVWEMRNLALLLSSWPKLDTLQVLWLKHSINGPLLPAPKIQLKRLSLAYLDITDSDLSFMLKGSKGTLDKLDLHRPTAKLTRAGVARILIEHGSTLTSLQLDVQSTWHPVLGTAPAAEASDLTEDRAAKCKYLIDGLIGHMKVLSELKLSGSLASTILFARLPKSVTVLAFEDNVGLDIPKVLALLKKKKTATNGKSKKSIPIVAPKLQCFTYSRTDGAMLSETVMRNLEKVLEQRKACNHWSYYDPRAVWRPSGNPLPSAVDMMGGFLGMAAMAAGGAPLPPGLDFDGFNFPVPLL